MIRRFIRYFILAPIALVLVLFAIANRHMVSLSFDPFTKDVPAVSVQMPFYVFLFLALFLGIAIGGTVIWFSQSKYRRQARLAQQDARKWQLEAERLAQKAE